MTKNKILLAAVLFAFLANGPAFAVDVPSTAEPSRIEKQIAPLPKASTGIDGAGSVSGTAISAPPGADKVKFVLKSVVIDGAKAYDEKTLSRIYADKIGKTISLADVYGMAEAVMAKYRNAGYILTQVVVPPQTIDGGRVRLRVIEGYIDDVRVEGEEGTDASYFLRFADKIKNGGPLNARKLERYLLLMNDMPGITARAVLSPSPTKVGASDLTIIITRKMFDVFSQLDNRGSRYLGPMQLNVGGRLNNIFGLSEGLSFQHVTTPHDLFETDSELNYYSLGWSQPLNREGTRLNVTGSLTRSRPGFELSEFEVQGLSRSLNFELTHPLVRTRNANLNVALKFNYLNSEREDNILVGRITDRVRALRFNTNFQFSDRWLGSNTLAVELSKGIDVFNMKDTSTSSSRAQGDPEFVKMTLEISRLQRISNRIEVFFDMMAQRTPDILLASEEMGIGGARFGSAYDSSEITGEDGLAARIEVRMSNPLPALGADYSQAYAFIDGGKSWDDDNAIVRYRRRSLVSTGVGFRLNLNQNLASTFEAAIPLTHEVEVEDNNDPRFFGTVSLRF